MDITWTEAICSLGIGVGLAAATGMRVFLPLLVLGAAARLEWLPLSGGFEWLSSWPAIGALAVAALLEVGAYYVPIIDNFLDVVAGPLAVLAGVIATAAVITDLPPMVRWSVAIVAGGGTAGVVQTVSSIVRLKSTTFTGGLGNFIVATLELEGSLVASIIAILAPVIAIFIVTGVLLVSLDDSQAASQENRSQSASLELGFLGSALTQIVRTVLKAVGRRDLVGRFLLRELQLGKPNGFHLLRGAVRKDDLFARHKKDLSDWHRVRAWKSFPRL